jgi:hypothetical protein
MQHIDICSDPSRIDYMSEASSTTSTEARLHKIRQGYEECIDSTGFEAAGLERGSLCGLIFLVTG